MPHEANERERCSRSEASEDRVGLQHEDRLLPLLALVILQEVIIPIELLFQVKFQDLVGMREPERFLVGEGLHVGGVKESRCQKYKRERRQSERWLHE